MTVAEEEKQCQELSQDLGRYYYYPFSRKKFQFQRVTYMDLVKMELVDLEMLNEISKDWEKVLQYKGKVEAYAGKLPESFIRENCFKLVFDKHFTMCCYIDIVKSDDTCIVFDIFPNFDYTE